MKNKHVGYLILGITLIFLFLVLSFNSALESIVTATCTHGDSCSMHTTIKTQKMISYGLMSLLFLIGAFLVFFMKEAKQEEIKEKKINLENLEQEELQIINILKRGEGSTYQHDIIKETKLSKVKVTRILDKLEGKGILERKRRGMANIVLLRN